MAKISKEAKANYQKRLGERIKGYRELRDITMNQVADKIGKTQATVSRYETGEIGMTKTTLARIVDYLQIPASDLPNISDFEDFNDDDGFELMLSYTDDGVVQTESHRSISIPVTFSNMYKSLILVSVDTDLIDERVNRDAILIVDLDSQPADGDLVYFAFNNVERIYEYTTTNQSIVLQPSSRRVNEQANQNGDTHSIVINKHNPLERKKLNMIGVVVGYVSDSSKRP